MARITLSEALKQAISRLPSKEKDKLLFRLIAKDRTLAQQLEFRLLEASSTTETRREDVHVKIGQALQVAKRDFSSPGYLLMDLRSLSGMINDHVKTTRDKYGEIELNFYLLNEALELLGREIRRFSLYRTHKLDKYVVGRAQKLLKLLVKIHEDYHLDFREDMQQLGRHISEQPNMMAVAMEQRLDVKSLLRGEVPEAL